MTRRWALASGALAALALTACQDSVATTSGPAGSESFQRYVAVGTSVSMGTQSDGIIYTTQARAWTALLAAQAYMPFTEPLLRVPGCRVPLVAPLQFSRRLSGRSVTQGDTTCAGLLPGITPPTQNVALDGATAFSALNITPQIAAATPPVPTGSQRQARQLYPLVLRPTQTQVTAMLSERPTLVSVELGANEVLGTVSGIVIPTTDYTTPAPFTIVTPATFYAQYDKIIDSVKASGAKALLTGAVNITSIPSMRKGSEIFSSVVDSLTFNAFYITLSSNCATTAADNLIFTPQKVLLTAGAAAQAAGLGQPKPVFSCADVPGTQDFILTPADVQFITDSVNAMDAHIRQLATANGFAYLDLNALLATVRSLNVPFNIQQLLACNYPFGQYTSLDGVHPTSYGHRLVANEAAKALNAKYGFAIPTRPVQVLSPAQLCQ